MSEFDERWAQIIDQAKQRALFFGRGEVADYLQLRVANDALRAASVEWLIAIFEWLANEATRTGQSVEVERTDAHQFKVGTATMLGTLFTLRRGVRRLMIEAGWPRSPQHGIVRGQGLASAYIKHFGQRAANEELLLARAEDDEPQWLVLSATNERERFSEARAHQHVAQFLKD